MHLLFFRSSKMPGGYIMPLLSYTDAPDELLTLFHTEKESVLARYYEPDPGLFIAESAKVTLRAVQAGYQLISMFVEDAQLNREAQDLISRFPDLPVYHAPSKEYLEISGYPMTRGILSLFRRKENSRPEPVNLNNNTVQECSSSDHSSKAYSHSAFADEKANPFTDVIETVQNASRIAVLVEVGNPANIGSIFRNAAALGIDTVLLTKGCCDPLSRRCLRVSMGCVFQVPWIMTGLSGQDLARQLKMQGFHTVAMALSDVSVSITDPTLKLKPRLAIFLGNEGNGLPKETISSCDSVVRIPMDEGVDSLNVAAASAVAFWELRTHP